MSSLVVLGILALNIIRRLLNLPTTSFGLTLLANLHGCHAVSGGHHANLSRLYGS